MKYNVCYPSQPNDQARIVAPVSSLSNIERISRKDDARLLLIVRHPFDRQELLFHQDLHFIFQVSVSIQGQVRTVPWARELHTEE